MVSIRDVAAPVVGAARQPWDEAVDAALRRYETNTVQLDSFQNSSGTRTDRQMMADAMTYAAAQSQPPAIMLGARDHDFSATGTTGFNPYTGFALLGPADAGLMAQEQNTKAPKARVLCNNGNGTQSTFYANGGGSGASIYSAFTCANIGWRSTNNVTQWLHAPISAVNMYGCSFGNMNFTGFRNVIGQPNDAATVTLATMWGAWNIPNMAGTPFSFRGSDNWLVPDECNIGWNAGPAGTYLWRCENLQKTVIRGLYLTCRVGATRGLLVDNGASTTQGGLWIMDCVIEGQNLSEPAAGALIYVNSNGEVTLHNIAFNFAMGNPTAQSPTDTAYIIANLGTHGLLNAHDFTVTRATGVGQDVPVIDHQGTGKVFASRFFGQPGNGGGQLWTDLPAVKKTGTGYTEIDSTLRYLTGFGDDTAQQVRTFVKEGAVVANDFAGWPHGCRVGSLATDVTNGKLYICTATNGSTTSTWTVVGAQT